jgi:hypothetical protein
MIQLLRKVGVPLSFFTGAVIKPPLTSNTDQSINPKYFESSISSNLPLVIPEVDSSNFIKFLGEDFDKKFQIHSIDNYLNNPPSLNKIKQHHQSIVKDNVKSNNLIILKKEDLEITCDNVENYLNQKIEIKTSPSIILGKTIKASESNKVKASIRKKGNKYVIENFDLDSWFMTKFWWLYILAAPFGLILIGTIASSVKKSENWNKRNDS